MILLLITQRSENMGRFKIFVFATALLFFIPFTELYSQTPLTEAVDFHVKTPDGTTIYLFQLLDDDKIVVIDFFSVGCGYCQTYAPDFQASYEDFGENDGNVFFMKINWGSDNAAVRNFDSIYGQTMPTVSGTQGGGNQVFNDYQILSYPTVIVITPDHKIFNQYIWPPDNYQIDSVVIAAGGILTGTGENLFKNGEVSIYPNPAGGYCFIKVNGEKGFAGLEYDITDMAGMVVTDGKAKVSDGITYIPLRNMNSGLYFVRFYKHGIIFAVKRLMVK